MARWIAVPASLALASLLACTGEISLGDSDVEVTHLALGADSLGALQAEACVEVRGQTGCPAYPNPLACELLRVSVRGDGSTVGACSIAGHVTRTLRGVREGIPVVCRMDHANGCVQCEDIYGGAVVDTCDRREAQLFSGQGFVPADDVSTTTAATGTAQSPPSATADSAAGSTPVGSGGDRCDVQQAFQTFVEKLNALLAGEGFKLSWSPELDKLAEGSAFFGGSAFSFADEVCSGDALGVQDITSCDLTAKAKGGCYCENGLLGVRCRCSRMTAKVLAETCGTIPEGCDGKAWGAAIWKVYGAATQWLVNTPLSGLTSNRPIADVTSPEEITCLTSPLVLDLEDDGVALGAAAQGVRFDLLGSGAVRTAWVEGKDDALLALDRDGDGRISSGAELFGEGSTFGGRLAGDGFAALAVLDRPDHGGNGNGLLDPDDLAFDQLLLWTDANHDGQSAPEELRPLGEAGVVGLELAATRAARVVDRHGNDLSLRARFLRRGGGSGLLVDALFTNR